MPDSHRSNGHPRPTGSATNRADRVAARIRIPRAKPPRRKEPPLPAASTGEVQESSKAARSLPCDEVRVPDPVMEVAEGPPDYDLDDVSPEELAVIRSHASTFGMLGMEQQLKQQFLDARLGEMTARELHEADCRLDYLIDGLLVAGQPLIVAGAQKTLKTNLTLAACISLASGKPFLGRSITRQVKVCMCSGESGMATIQETARRICKSRGLSLPDLENFLFAPRLPRLGGLGVEELVLASLLARHAVEVLVLDPAYMCIPGDEASNLFVMGERLRKLADICQKYQCTLVLLHHTKHGVVNPHEPPELADIAWAGFAEFARQWWLLGRREKYAPGTGLHRLWFNAGGSAGHSTLLGLNIDEGAQLGARKWQVQVLSADEARKKARAAIAREKQAEQSEAVDLAVQAIVRVLEQLPTGTGETPRTLRDLARLGAVTAGHALARAMQQGLIETVAVHKNGKQYEGYRIRATPDALGQ